MELSCNFLTLQPIFTLNRRGGREGYNTLLNTDLR